METVVIISLILLILVILVLVYYIFKLKKVQQSETHRANINEILAKKNRIEAEKYRNQTMYFFEKCKQKDKIIKKQNKKTK